MKFNFNGPYSFYSLDICEYHNNNFENLSNAIYWAFRAELNQTHFSEVAFRVQHWEVKKPNGYNRNNHSKKTTRKEQCKKLYLPRTMGYRDVKMQELCRAEQIALGGGSYECPFPIPMSSAHTCNLINYNQYHLQKFKMVFVFANVSLFSIKKLK